MREVDVGPSAARLESPGRAVAIEPPLCGRLLHRTNGQEVIRSEVARCSWLVPLLKARASAGSSLGRREVRPVPNVPQPPLFAPLFGLSFWLKKAGKNNTIHQILEQV